MEYYIYATERLTVWGSNKTVRAFGDLPLEAGGDALRFILIIESFLMALREDLGHSTIDVPRGSILRLFVNDFDEQLEKLSTAKSNAPEDIPAIRT